MRQGVRHVEDGVAQQSPTEESTAHGERVRPTEGRLHPLEKRLGIRLLVSRRYVVAERLGTPAVDRSGDDVGVGANALEVEQLGCITGEDVVAVHEEHELSARFPDSSEACLVEPAVGLVPEDAAVVMLSGELRQRVGDTSGGRCVVDDDDLVVIRAKGLPPNGGQALGEQLRRHVINGDDDRNLQAPSCALPGDGLESRRDRGLTGGLRLPLPGRRPTAGPPAGP